MRPAIRRPMLGFVMEASEDGGIMDATHTATLTQSRWPTNPTRVAAAVGSFVLHVLKTSARGDDFDRMFQNAPGAQFGALPRGSQQRHLDRGYRP